MNNNTTQPITPKQTDQDVINDRPIVAVLAQDVTLKGEELSYIAASYVKYIESAGGRVVPILTTFDTTTIKHLFTCINGLLIPGM